MKKIGIWFLTGLICLIIFIIFNYYWYSKVTNDFVNSVVALVLDNYENMINEKEYNKDILKDLNVYEEIYLQPNRKTCALLPTKAIRKVLENM